MSTKNCDISEMVQDRTKVTMQTNRKSRTCVRFVRKSMTLHDLEWLKHTLVQKNHFTEPTRKI